ncbi:MAG: ATP-binding protein [Candidatus Rokubacteria bacterium]|nr:ATP-binding protein [Candidatus Rokubacteria bacterium]
MGETRVDLLHLLEDLRDAYPGAAEETILTEVVANSLDSGATAVTIAIDPARATLTIVDDGVGMRRRDLARYHDVAATTKARGEGIGFAGVGIKIGLLVSEEVLTETRLGKHHLATVWRLASRHRAPWKWVPPPGLVAEHGTAVRLQLKNPLSPLLDPGFIEGALWRHFQPLLDPALTDILTAHYPRGVRFVVNGRPLAQEGSQAPERAPIAVRLARKRRPSASGYLIRDRLPLAEERRGLAISTFGKVIKRGWDWLGITPSSPERVAGLIEAPALAQALTLSKADFIRAGARGAIYLAYRKAIQEAVARQLAVWGDLREAGEPAHRRAARPVERDLEAVLLDLADEFPLLAALVERRAGGQRALPMGGGPVEGQRPGGLVAGPAQPAAEPQPAHVAPPATEGPEEPGAPEPAAPEPLPREATVELPSPRGPRRPARYGLSIQFEQRPDDPELARLVETTVWVNEAHPAYRRAVASRSEGYHIAVASAMALAPLAVEPDEEHAFVTAFLASWGAALDRRKGRGRR